MKAIIVLLMLAMILNVEGRILCEPNKLKNHLGYWLPKYNIKPTPMGFIAGIFHQSNFIFPYDIRNQTEFERDTMVEEGNSYVHWVAIKYTSMVLPFKRTNSFVTFNLLRGDSALIHVINEAGELATTELGFHSNTFFAIIEKATWYAFEFPRHWKEEYALLGISVLRGRSHHMDISLSTDPGELSKKFPAHEGLIRRLA